MPGWYKNVFDNFSARFYNNFIKDDRWRYLWNGLGVTLKITFCALIIGVVLGFIIAAIRSTYDLNKNVESRKAGSKGGNFFLKLSHYLLNILNMICNVYLAVIRGTPIVVQILIMYFIIITDASFGKVPTAILTFGLNSAAYVAEIFRSGIMSIDKGQFEAGRSLGFNYVQTMVYIIMPQAFKNVLPTLGNEAIVLLKETAVSGYIALEDLTKGGDIIRSRTLDAFMPLIAVALIYFIIVMVMTFGVNKLERRLRNSDH